MTSQDRDTSLGKLFAARQEDVLHPDTCPCVNPYDQYLMEIDCGTAVFIHAVCGKPPGPWFEDAFTMRPVAVTLDCSETDEGDAHGVITVNGIAPDVQYLTDGLVHEIKRRLSSHGPDIPVAEPSVDGPLSLCPCQVHLAPLGPDNLIDTHYSGSPEYGVICPGSDKPGIPWKEHPPHD